DAQGPVGPLKRTADPGCEALACRMPGCTVGHGDHDSLPFASYAGAFLGRPGRQFAAAGPAFVRCFRGVLAGKAFLFCRGTPPFDRAPRNRVSSWGGDLWAVTGVNGEARGAHY